MGKKWPVAVESYAGNRKERKESLTVLQAQASESGALRKATKDPLPFTYRTRLLIPEEEVEFIDKWIAEGERLQNHLIDGTNQRLKELEASDEYNDALTAKSDLDSEIRQLSIEKKEAHGKEEKERISAELETKKAQRDAANKKVKELRKEYKLTEYGLFDLTKEEVLKSEGYEYPEVMNVACRRYVAKKVSAALTRYFDKNGKAIHNRAEGTVNSIGYVAFCDSYFDPITKSLVIPDKGCEKGYHFLKLEANDRYGDLCLGQEIKTLEITRKGLEKKRRYFAHLSISGYVPNKYDADGNLKYNFPAAQGRVGIVFDPRGCLAVVGSDLYEFDMSAHANSEAIIKKLLRLQNEMSRLRVRDNPDFYNTDGTSKTKEETEALGLTWYHSPEYRLIRSRFNRLSEKQVNIRKNCHYETINAVLQLGDQFAVLDVKYNAQMRKDPHCWTGEDKKKRKLIRDAAPADAKTKLKWKLHYNGSDDRLYSEEDTSYAEAYRHDTDTYDHEMRSRDYVNIDGHLIYHGAYVAFLLAHLKPSEKKHKVGVENSPVWTKKTEGQKRERKVETKTASVGFDFDLEAIKRDFPRFVERYNDIFTEDRINMDKVF